MKHMVYSVVIMSVLLCSSLAFAQYEEDPYIEGYVGANISMPMGYLKNDLMPDSLNATGKIGLDFGAGYYVKSKLIIGLYMTIGNMGTKEVELNHRAYELGSYAKYLISDITEASVSPYVKLSAGINFSKMATRVDGETGPILRELSLGPTLGTSFALGVHFKTNDYGAIFVEAAYSYDLTSGVSGEYKGKDYEWGDNNQYLLLKAGVAFNIGPKE